jgi:phospholipid/cholesterol/gamma-HCH transport system ATP-binding protein
VSLFLLREINELNESQLKNKLQKIIEIRELKTTLEGQSILDNINIDIYRNEIFGIVGGSGCGKTTLLRNILMLQKPTSGSIKVFGIDITKCSEAQAIQIQRRWSVTFQHSALFSSLTVIENVLFPLRTLTHLNPRLQKEIAYVKIALVGLPLDAASKYPSELSGGMQKRAALARAIAMDPELLFLDEPTTGLDPKSAEGLDELILRLHEALELTIVMVTHDLDSLWHDTDRVAFLGDGKILEVLPMSELSKKEHPMIKEYFSGLRGQRILQQ